MMSCVQYFRLPFSISLIETAPSFGISTIKKIKKIKCMARDYALMTAILRYDFFFFF